MEQQNFKPGDRVVATTARSWWTPGKVYVVNTKTLVMADDGGLWKANRGVYSFAPAPDEAPAEEDKAVAYLKKRVEQLLDGRDPAEMGEEQSCRFWEVVSLLEGPYGFHVGVKVAKTVTLTIEKN